MDLKGRVIRGFKVLYKDRFTHRHKKNNHNKHYYCECEDCGDISSKRRDHLIGDGRVECKNCKKIHRKAKRDGFDAKDYLDLIRHDCFKNIG